jgi:urea carboxylase-associated protein 2
MRAHPAKRLFEESLPSGSKWSHVLKRHQVLRIIDVEGGANVSALFFNRDLLSERYSMPDTLKAQHTSFLTHPRVLFSDMGRVMASIVADTCGWHDTLGGHLDARLGLEKYGERRYQKYRNEYYRNAHDAFLMELGKWGLGKQDLVPNVNFFSKVVVDENGALRFEPNHSRADTQVDLRAEMNLLVILVSMPHPLSPDPSYAPKPIELVVLRGAAPLAGDACRTSRPEVTRGFENTERYFT